MQIPTKRLYCRVAFLGLFLVAAFLGGCGGGGGGSTSSAGTSTLSLGVTDAPVDGVTQVVIEFTRVQLHSSSGNTLDFTLASPKQIDLLQLAGGKSMLLLDHQSLTAGQYDWIRLFVDTTDVTHSYVMTAAGAQEPITIPSNAQTGLKLNRPFTLTAAGVASFVIDFNLRQSLHLANGSYILRPTLRIVDATTTGSIAGTVDPALVTAQGCVDSTATSGAVGGAVYVYDGSGVTPVDVDTNASGVQPLTSATVAQDGNGNWQYTAAYLDPGAYTVAFTCQSTSDSPDTTDGIAFQGAADVSVVSGQTTTHNFP